MDPQRLAQRRAKADAERTGKCTNCGRLAPWDYGHGHHRHTCSAACLAARRSHNRKLEDSSALPRKCTNCGKPTPMSKNWGYYLRTCSPQCLKARRGKSVTKGQRWQVVDGNKIPVREHECEYCHKRFPEPRNKTANRFCSRACAFAQLRKDRRGKSCSVWCAYCVACNKAFVARIKRKYCGRACQLQCHRDKQRSIDRARPRPRCVCIECHEVFYPEPGKKNRQYCAAHTRHRCAHCAHCGGPIPKTLRWSNRKTCSTECLNARLTEVERLYEATRIFHDCVHCGKRFKVRDKGKVNAFCSRSCTISHRREVGSLESLTKPPFDRDHRIGRLISTRYEVVRASPRRFVASHSSASSSRTGKTPRWKTAHPRPRLSNRHSLRAPQRYSLGDVAS